MNETTNQPTDFQRRKASIIAAHRGREGDALSALLTAFPTLGALCEAKGGYRPSLRRGGRDWFEQAMNTLADLYDAEQVKRGDARRAF